MTIFKRISMPIGLWLLITTIAFADAKTHEIVFHVDESDLKVMNMALENVQNFSNYPADKGEKSSLSLLSMAGHNR
ncbi:hypothetical protein N9315_04415 [Alphaproteobacteria bacterium]|nr:hypothetical protein [Alphaproteobacteria bacterium]